MTILVSVLVVSVVCFCVARFVFLSPSCYADNNSLTNQENYFIKKVTLEAVENRLSVINGDGKHLFVWINSTFMDSISKENDEYIVKVQTHYMESVSDDCVYEIHLSDDFSITFFELEP